jgi:tryptophanyl-tRNA synthetase
MSTAPEPQSDRPVILTGDRTTGPLHLGHYVGSLRNRVALQHSHRQYLLLADAQALTDNAQDPAKVRRYVLEVATDYLAVRIDPSVTTICVQSRSPADWRAGRDAGLGVGKGEMPGVREWA